MKKRVLFSALSLLALAGCGDSYTLVKPQMTTIRPFNSDKEGYGTGTGYSDPYATGTGYGTGYTSPSYPVATSTPCSYCYTPQPGNTNMIPTATQPLLLVNPKENPMTPYRNNFFKNYGTNPFIETSIDPLSTFSLDIDTGAYSIGRNELKQSKLPPIDSVRTEEYLNAFDYHYPQPEFGKLAIHTDLTPSYFGENESYLLRVGIQGKDIQAAQRKDALLTYVIDVSGSMDQENRLELVKRSLIYLLNQLRATDQIAIVVYGSSARTLLPHTPANQKELITNAIQNLRPEGSTNVEAGLSRAYQEANRVYQPERINRVILCSDGVANMGQTSPTEILNTIKKHKENGITLTTLGFGMENYNDTLMEQLANQGDGQYAYIDTLDQAQKLFGSDLASSLQVIAKDAKIQVEFNGTVVEQYRLMGYENRNIADQDFENPNVDAGEVGANHSVTALYEIKLKPNLMEEKIANVKLNYKDVDQADQVQSLSKPVYMSQQMTFQNASPSLKLAASVAEFAEILRQSVFANEGKLGDVLNIANSLQALDPQNPQLQEFSSLVSKAKQLQQPVASPLVLNVQNIVQTSQNPQQLPEWKSYLLKQLGGMGLR